MSAPETGEILTLEPLVEAVRAGMEGAGWALSGLQKTTSHEFEGRWEGESTRSAYLFFHHARHEDVSSIDVYLDETSQGLTGNLALVVDLPPLGRLGDPAEALASLGRLSRAVLGGEHAAPLTLRLRLERADDDPGAAEVEVRFKVRIPRRAVAAGRHAVSELGARVVGAFERILGSEELARYTQRR